MSFQQREFGGALRWSFAMNWGRQGTNALVRLVLMALLPVEDFGVVGMAWLYLLFVEMILDQGFGAAIIQRKNLGQKHMESVFWLVFAVSLLLCGGSVLLSGWWANVNSEPRVASIISAMSIIIPIKGLTTVQNALLQRSLDFRKLAIRNFVSVSIGGAAGIACALTGFGIWSLVVQHVLEAGLSLVLLWTVSKWRPRFQFSLSATRDLLGFSTSTFIARVGVFASSRADQILVGIFFGAFAVGIYRAAISLMSMIVDLGARAISTVSFPQFARSQGDLQKVREDLEFCFWLAATLTVPALGVLAGVSDALMATLGNQWVDAADVLKLLCLTGAAQVVTNFVAPLLQGMGRPSLLAVVVWGTALISSVGFVAVGIGAQDMAESDQPLAMALIRGGLFVFVFVPMSFMVLRSVCGFSLGALLRAFRGSSITAILAYGGIRGLAAGDVLAGWSAPAQLAAQAVVGLVIAAVSIMLVDATARDRVGSIIRPFVHGRGPKPPSAGV